MTGHPRLIGRVTPHLARTERDKSCHVFPLPENGDLPATLRAYCGFSVSTTQLEQLEFPRGMPCVSCLLLSHTGDQLGY